VQPDGRVPILQGLVQNEQLNGLIGESSSNQDLRSTLELQLSDFFAHFESVADSKNFQPWWPPWSRKYTARTSLLESLQCLRYHCSILLVDVRMVGSVKGELIPLCVVTLMRSVARCLRGPKSGGLLASITSILQISKPTTLKPFACATRRTLPSRATAPRLRSAHLRRSNPLKLKKFGAAFVSNSLLIR
jgi:hypothetical protein